MPESRSAVATTEHVLTVERTLGDHAATGKVTVLDGSHAPVAGAVAWHTLALAALADDRLDDAIACAEAGLDELGTRYRARRVKDSSKMKIAAARLQIEDGARKDGATVLTNVLDERIDAYFQVHRDAVGPRQP